MTRDQATQLGNEMVAKLGEGWTLHVHNNIGWHAYCKSPSKHLYVSVQAAGPSGKPTYMCLMSEDPERYPNCGADVWSLRNTGKIHSDPVEAVLEQVQYARAKVDALLAAVVEAEKTIANFTCPCCGKPRVK